jgi:hypothetical protein
MRMRKISWWMTSCCYLYWVQSHSELADFKLLEMLYILRLCILVQFVTPTNSRPASPFPTSTGSSFSHCARHAYQPAGIILWPVVCIQNDLISDKQFWEIEKICEISINLLQSIFRYICKVIPMTRSQISVKFNTILLTSFLNFIR